MTAQLLTDVSQYIAIITLGISQILAGMRSR